MIEDFVTKSHELTNINRNNLSILHIGFGADANYLIPAGISLSSIAINNPNLFLVFHIFTNNYSDTDLKRLKQTSKQFNNISIYIYKINDSIISHLPIKHNYPISIYYRLLMPTALKEHKQFLYLDCDILCLNDISKLAKLNLKGNIAATILDEYRTAYHREKTLNLPLHTYFNSGVMLINTSKWLKEKITPKTLDILARNQIDLLLPDQDALNILLTKKVLYLPKIWNHIQKNKYSKHLNPEIKFLHYAGPAKPWKKWCINATQPLYLHYKNQTQWAETPLEEPKNLYEMKKYCKKLFIQGKIIEALIVYLTKVLYRSKNK